ncbi:MAG: putative C-S lyase [Bacteroidales bacterium]|nr:putative C-S lyase [Bacteroidales bacterium]
MTQFDFAPDRRQTSSVKHDLTEKIFGKEDVIPLWVADMDFETPDFVRQAVVQRAMHPVYGYTFRDESYYEAIAQWLWRRHNWKVQRESLLFVPGVVPALNLIVMALTNPGDEIIIQSPVYFPFFGAVKDHGRVMVNNQLIEERGSYRIDFDQLEQQARTAKMLILCNPHNPVGRSWTRDELQKIADICLRHKVLVLSDEIHNDLVMPGFRHQVFANISPEVAQISITAHAASKTFNLAGLATASLIVDNVELRQKITTVIQHFHLDMGNLFGIEATKAAFLHGDIWLDELITYIDQNYKTARGFFMQHLPSMVVSPLEATYLMWLDFGWLGLSDENLRHKMIQEAGLGLNPGIDFGPGGENHLRLNLACPRATLLEALQKMAKVFA